MNQHRERRFKLHVHVGEPKTGKEKVRGQVEEGQTQRGEDMQRVTGQT